MYSEFTVFCNVTSYQVTERDSGTVIWQGVTEGIEFIPALMEVTETVFYNALRKLWTVRRTPQSNITHAEKLAIIQAYQEACDSTMAQVRKSLM